MRYCTSFYVKIFTRSVSNMNDDKQAYGVSSLTDIYVQ